MQTFRPQLYGPDTKYGAWKDPTLKRYVWHVIWNEGRSRRRRSLSVEYGGDYSQALAEKIAELHRPDPGSRIIADALARYLDEHRKFKHGLPQSRCITRRLLSWWAGKTVDDITEALCRQYADQWRSRASGRTHLAYLSAAINFCKVPDAPKVWMPAPADPRARVVTDDEYGLIVEDFTHRGMHHLALATHICWFTAARIESVLTLRWEKQDGAGWIDLDGGVIHFKPFGRAATSKVKPVCPIARSLRPILEAARAEATKRDWQWVCQSNRGTKLVYQSAWGSLQHTLERCKIEPFSWHAFCHSRITALGELGISIPLIAQYSGRSPRTIINVYMHLQPKGGAKDVADKI